MKVWTGFGQHDQNIKVQMLFLAAGPIVEMMSVNLGIDMNCELHSLLYMDQNALIGLDAVFADQSRRPMSLFSILKV